MDPRSLSNKKTGGSRGQTAKTVNAARPMILSDEEKHQLIMAHAANRKPTDRVQQFSLVVGVFICAVAIGLGWLYSVRQSMAKVFPTSTQSVQADQTTSLRSQYEQQIRTGADSMIKQVEKIENEQLGGGLDQLIQTGLQLASTTNMLIASSTQNTVHIRN
ncbi:MAG: hypothetical protein WC750_05750 [Patescibacteria group bacterium]|jgi:hypothetical protein